MWALVVAISFSTLLHGFAANGEVSKDYRQKTINTIAKLIVRLKVSHSDNYETNFKCTCPEAKFNQPDYYWRDYFGIVPDDAVEGGFTETGNKTYVGQMASSKIVGIFPVYLIPGMKGGIGAILEKVYEDTYVKILCSPHHKEFQWKPTTMTEMYKLTAYHWVIGGSQGKLLTYIGRANYLNQVQIGRIHTKEIPSGEGLWINDRNEKQMQFKEYDILVLPR